MKVPTKKDILERLLKEAKELYPENIWVPGLPHTDFAITIPLAEGYRNFLLSLYTMFLSTVQGINFMLNSRDFLSLLRDELGLTDTELNSMLERDIKARVYPFSPSMGSPSYGYVRVFLINQNYMDLSSPEDIYFIDNAGNRYKPLIYGRLIGQTDTDTGRVYVDIPVISMETGSDKNIDPNSIMSFESNNPSLNQIIGGITNPESFSFGKDKESLKDFASRLVKWHSIQRGVDYLPYVENLFYSMGAEDVLIKRTGDKYYFRGYGIDIWVRLPESYVTILYSNTAIYPTIQPIIKVNGTYLVTTNDFDPKINAYALSIRQKLPSTLSTGDTITINPAVFQFQQMLESLNQTWWLGGTAALVRMGLATPINIQIQGKVTPKVSIATIKEKLNDLLKENYSFGATVYFSDLLNWLLDAGMEYAYLDTMQVTSDVITISNDTQKIQFEFYQYPVLGELVINEV